MVCPRAGEEGDHRDMTGISIRQLSGSTGIGKTIIVQTAKAHKTEEASPRLIGLEEFENINFGVVGMDLFEDEVLVYKGGGYAKHHNKINLWSFGIFYVTAQGPLYGDDENDHIQIERGIKLWKSMN